MLINETKERVWHGRVKVADTFFKRFRGLMLKPKIDYALVFILPGEARINATIHMFFMLQSIDILFLDRNMRVVDIREARPWRIYIPKKSVRYVVETPAGVAKYLDAGEGDLIKWVIEEEKEKAIPSPMGALDRFGVNNVKSSISLAEPKPKLKEP